ncbi:hypothetical protein C4565_09615 [Candidatus Parcubacteria bacterium]|nr:MAG: hypothetical protein C4565_09615 [Candidatus Parcubacteria bacterium]
MIWVGFAKNAHKKRAAFNRANSCTLYLIEKKDPGCQAGTSLLDYSMFIIIFCKENLTNFFLDPAIRIPIN